MAIRKPRKGEWLLLPDKTVAVVDGRWSDTSKPGMWLKTRTGNFISVAIDGNYQVFDGKPTHTAVFRRNIWFGGFSSDEMTREVIMVGEASQHIIILIDIKTMRLDHVFLDEIALTCTKYPLVIEFFEGNGIPDLSIPAGKVVWAQFDGLPKIFSPDTYYLHLGTIHDWRERRKKQALLKDIIRCHLGHFNFEMTLYDALQAAGADLRLDIQSQTVQWAVKARSAEERLGASTGVITWRTWGDVRMDIYKWRTALKMGFEMEPPPYLDFWCEYVITYELTGMLDSEEMQGIVQRYKDTKSTHFNGRPFGKKEVV